jgi:hypothetical protein
MLADYRKADYWKLWRGEFVVVAILGEKFDLRTSGIDLFSSVFNEKKMLVG